MSNRTGWQAAAHIRLSRRWLPPGAQHRGDRQSRLGQSDDWIGHGHAARLREEREMAIRGDYLGMALSIDDLDGENVEYFRHCAEHDFHLQQCEECNLLRYP